MKKALIAMSGGIDSSMAAYFTKQAGYECTGTTMRLYNNEAAGLAEESECCSLRDTEDARSVALSLGMRFVVFNYTDLFKEKVMKPFAEAYAKGCTPNPCIDCNRNLKFGVLLQRADELGCELLVTGHYAQLEKDREKILLKKAVDPKKDQSYVLYMLDQKTLSRLSFPLGAYKKEEIRKMAENLGFRNANKPDSQDICFVPDGDYAAAVTRISGLKFKPGDFIDEAGQVVGRHRGIIHYTVGQRKGLGIAFKEPYYVTRIDADHRAVILGTKEKLFKYRLTAEDFNWTLGELPPEGLQLTAKIRYHGPEEPVKIHAESGNTVTMEFTNPQRAITPGQAVVAYAGDVLIGGGTIVSAE